MTIAVTSYLAAALMALIFMLVSLSERSRGRSRHLLAVASAASCCWAGSVVYQGATDPDWLGSRLLELIRDLSWVAFLLYLLDQIHGGRLERGRLRVISIGVLVGVLTCAVLAAGKYFSWFRVNVGGVDFVLVGHLALAVVGLVLVEQIFRDTDAERLRAVKYFCFGLGGIFAYDLYLYSDALLLQKVAPDLWSARGFVNALAIPVIGVAVARNPERSSGVFLSRRLVFRTTALLGSGVYLLVLGAGGYYVREYGGTWGGVAQVSFLFVALLILLVLFYSVPLRTRLWVLVNKHLFHNKYDYREEWLRFIGTLSHREHAAEWHERAIQAIAQIIGSPGGLLYMRRDSGYFEAGACWNMRPATGREPADSSLVRFLERHQWIINLDQYQKDPMVYANRGDLTIPAWLCMGQTAWLVVPLALEDYLLGFVVLARPPAYQRDLNWEDWDLLRMAGRQAANHLAQHEALQALEKNRRFEEVNRLSAYIVHDIKNLATQLGLVVANAERHKHNRDFVEDACDTVKGAVARMNRLLAQLQPGSADKGSVQFFQIMHVLKEVVTARERAGTEPVPVLECLTPHVYITADRDKFAMAIGHLIQNAQDATPADGSVVVRLWSDKRHAIIEVEDNGVGMDDGFIKAKLFQPFATTKGAAGMGIGVHQVRQFVQTLGGEIDVESSPGRGTTFRMYLPLSALLQEIAEQEPAPLSGIGDRNERRNAEAADCRG